MPAMAEIHQDIKTFSFKNLRTIADNTLKIKVTVTDEKSKTPYQWYMTPSNRAIFYDLLENIPQRQGAPSSLNIVDPTSGYKGLQIDITNRYSENIQAIVVYKGSIKTAEGALISADLNRELEYAIWGMNYTVKNQELMWKMLPINSFKDCVKLGNRLVETSPRQCLLTNRDIFLEVNEKATQESLSIKNFEDCLTKGQAIINTFPRRCIAAGGHVYTEAAKIR